MTIERLPMRGITVNIPVTVKPCPCCGSPMLPDKFRQLMETPPGSWERILQVDLKALEPQGVAWSSGGQYDGNTCCDACAELAGYTCVLCGEERTKAELVESIGYPAEHMCQPCYATVPAQTWDEKREELTEAHRYDWS